METSRILNPLTDFSHLSHWDRLLLHVLGKIQGGQIRLTLHDGQIAELGSDGGESVELRMLEKDLSKAWMLGGAMAFAETFIGGKWATSDLSALLRILAVSQQHMGRFAKGTSTVLRKMDTVMHTLRRNTRDNARKNIEEHYDLSNEMYKTFLDPTMMYSSGIFSGPSDTLADSQEIKIDRLIDQLDIQPTDHILEIGSGWGGCAIRMADKTGCKVTSLTLSPSQLEEGMDRVHAAGLEDQVEIRLQDYRDVEGQFDHIISIEMIEAVGHEFLPEYYRTVNDRLKSGGRFALQAITIPDERYHHYTKSSDFIRKHIFPGGHLPSPSILENIRSGHTDLKEHDNFEFGKDYAETLRRWRLNFFASLDQVRELGFEDAFIRKWHYYFAYCEAGFDTGMIHVRQICYQKA
jgi:cyclopropane-fatty-acyl-phospholipid synthase